MAEKRKKKEEGRLTIRKPDQRDLRFHKDMEIFVKTSYKRSAAVIESFGDDVILIGLLLSRKWH